MRIDKTIQILKKIKISLICDLMLKLSPSLCLPFWKQRYEKKTMCKLHYKIVVAYFQVTNLVLFDI